MSSGNRTTFHLYKWIDDSTDGSYGPWLNQAYAMELEQWTFPSHMFRPILRPYRWTAGSKVLWKYNYTEYTTFSGKYRTRGPAIVKASGIPRLEIKTSSTAGDAAAQFYKARARLGSGPLNLAENLGDFHKTAEMVAKRIRQIGEAARQLKNGNLPGLYQALALGGTPSRREAARVRDTPVDRRLADHWLEYTYGWAPLVGDAHAALEALRRRSIDPEGKTKSRTSSSSSPRTSDNVPGLPSKRSTGYAAGTVHNPGAHLLNGLGLLNPALLAWELLPYSFVVDWFLPIGDILASLTAGIGLKGVIGGIIYEEEQNELYDGKPWKTALTVKREAVYGIPDFIPIPMGAFDQSWRHVVSAVSLLAQRFR